jgi:hypothetical protein
MQNYLVKTECDLFYLLRNIFFNFSLKKQLVIKQRMNRKNNTIPILLNQEGKLFDTKEPRYARVIQPAQYARALQPAQ